MERAIAAAHRDYDRTTLEHRHDFRQIVFPEAGRLDLIVRGERGAVTAGQLAVVEPGAVHRCWTENAARCLIVDLNGDPRESARASAFRPFDARLRAVRDAVATELQLGGLAEPLIADGLSRYAAAALGDPPPADWSGRRRIARLAKEAIDAGFREELSVGALASAVGASESHLQRSFKAEHGIGIVGYVLERRLSHAAALLAETDMPVTEIALESGFATASYFSRRFAERYGRPPLRYRITMRAGSDKNPPQS